MKKNLFAVIFLLGLVFWGIYDMGKENISKVETETVNTNPEIENLKIGLQQGNLAPDFELENLKGEKIKLSDLKGKRVILNFWATWCPPCREEMPDMQKFYETYKDEKVTILGVNLIKTENSLSEVTSFVDEFGITFPIVLDKSKVAETYQVSAIPTSYLIDTNGVIRQEIVGPLNMQRMEELVLSLD